MAEIDIRKTHPNLYWLEMIIAVTGIGLGWNFIANSPTFLIFGAHNTLWGVLFLASGTSKIFFLNVVRRLRLVRAAMAFSVAYMMFLAIGTTQPYFEHKGSLQLPILYAGLSALQMPLLFEPFVNPWTSRK